MSHVFYNTAFYTLRRHFLIFMQISNHFISSIRAGLAVIFQIFYAMNYFLYLHVKSLCVVVMPDLWWLSHQIMYVCHYVWSHSSTLCSMEPRIDEEPEIVRPSPEITSLLTQQTNHQSEIIWNGEVKYLVLTTAFIFTLPLTFSKLFQSCISSSNNCYNFYRFCRTQAHLSSVVALRRWNTYWCKIIGW